MPSNQEEKTSPETESEKGPLSNVLKIFDTLAKICAAGAIVAGAFIANSYQSKMTAISILSQREKAESELRATMFSNLVSPIAGPYKENTEIPDRRLKLLVELLALNFHEHFELKPLMEYLDKRLSKIESIEERKSLRSIAIRIISRQIASILKEGSEKDKTEVHRVIYTESSENSKNEFQRQYLDTLSDIGTAKKFKEFIQKVSPDGKWTVDIMVADPDWDNETVRAYMNIKSTDKVYDDIAIDFKLTAFDFPLTDNTLLADGNRFAVALDGMDDNNDSKKPKSVALKLIWFPKKYFTPRERPINYCEFLEKLGINMNKKTANQ